VALPSRHAGFCRECFFVYFTRQVERAIHDEKMFTKDERLLVALSGGKDSLAVFRELQAQGYDVTGLHIDLAIGESSRNARAKVEAFCSKLDAELIVVDMEAEGLPIPAIKGRVNRPICSVCGTVKRHYFNRVAREGGFDVSITGHNLDDEVGRLFANTLRWDVSYLSDQGPLLPADGNFVKKAKPLYRLSEFETAAYCFMHGIEHHHDPCPYSSGASFPVRKELMNKLEEESPGQKYQFYQNFLLTGRPAFAAVAEERGVKHSPCPACESPTTAEICSVCRLKALLKEQTQEEHASQ
jgi:uncharacterized protein (TIGR00269 family)